MGSVLWATSRVCEWINEEKMRKSKNEEWEGRQGRGLGVVKAHGDRKERQTRARRGHEIFVRVPEQRGRESLHWWMLCENSKNVVTIIFV